MISNSCDCACPNEALTINFLILALRPPFLLGVIVRKPKNAGRRHHALETVSVTQPPKLKVSRIRLAFDRQPVIPSGQQLLQL